MFKVTQREKTSLFQSRTALLVLWLCQLPDDLISSPWRHLQAPNLPLVLCNPPPSACPGHPCPASPPAPDATARSRAAGSRADWLSWAQTALPHSFAAWLWTRSPSFKEARCGGRWSCEKNTPSAFTQTDLVHMRSRGGRKSPWPKIEWSNPLLDCSQGSLENWLKPF